MTPDLDEFRGTPGPYRSDPQVGVAGKCIVAHVWAPDGSLIAAIEPTNRSKEASTTARLFARSYDLALFCQHICALELTAHDAKLCELQDQARALLAQIVGRPK